MSTSVCGAAAATSATFVQCARGMTSTCVGATGETSRNANASSDDATITAGISPLAMRQNRQSSAMRRTLVPALPRCGRLRLVVPDAQEGALDVVVREQDGFAVRGRGLVVPAEPAEEVRPRGREVGVGRERR